MNEGGKKKPAPQPEELLDITKRKNQMEKEGEMKPTFAKQKRQRWRAPDEKKKGGMIEGPALRVKGKKITEGDGRARPSRWGDVPHRFRKNKSEAVA